MMRRHRRHFLSFVIVSAVRFVSASQNPSAKTNLLMRAKRRFPICQLSMHAPFRTLPAAARRMRLVGDPKTENRKRKTENGKLPR